MAYRPITDTLRLIGQGVFIDRISEQLSQATRAAEEQGKKSVLKIEITIKPANRGGAMVVTGNSVLTLPKAPAEDALLWATPEGNLVASDPKQADLPLMHRVDPVTGEISRAQPADRAA